MSQKHANPRDLSPEQLQEKVVKHRFQIFGCIGLFFAPFFIAGLFMLGSGVNRLNESDGDAIPLLFMGLVFVGVGVVPIYEIVVKSNSLISSIPLRKQYPGQPWMWREDWARGVVQDKTRGMMAGRWLAFVLTTVAIAFVFTQVRDWFDYYVATDPEITWAVAGLAVFIVISLLLRAIYITLQYRKFGSSTLLLSKNPCAVGSSLSGRIETSLGEIPQNGATLRLECIKATRSSSGKNSSTSYKTVWSAKQTLEQYRIGQGPSGVYVPVEFPIPADANPTGKASRSVSYTWKLFVSASIPGVDYQCEFEPPVFRVNRDGRVDGDVERS